MNSKRVLLLFVLNGLPDDVDANGVSAEYRDGVPHITSSARKQPSHAEVGVPRYRRVFTLSKKLDSEKVSAEFKHGVLKLRIPKAEHAQPRKIEIKVA